MCDSRGGATMTAARSSYSTYALLGILMISISCASTVKRSIESGSLRLVGGNGTAGRVEVYIDGVWGTVCDDLWDIDDAHVACRQLGFDGAISAPVRATFGRGAEPTQMDDVRCTGEEERLVDCFHRGNSEEDCGHHEDAGIVCYQESGSLRLVGGNDTAGRVEVYTNGAWGTVCDDLWDINDARVVCRQLGFFGAVSAPGGATFGQGASPVQMDNVRCTGREDRLVECTHIGSANENCGHTEDAGVVCFRETDGVVRLVNGNDTAGRVEVYLDGEWGTVCDDLWGLEDANVTCRQLGFTGAISALGYAAFGEGSGRIQMDNVGCSGREERLIDCSYIGSADDDCGHSEDAGVVCYMEKGAIRLAGGNSTAGRVEVYLYGEWGTVCHDDWGLDDAAVACRQLGFVGAASAPKNAAFGEGSGRILMDDVGCSGKEERLTSCSYQYAMRCSHSEDASVVCTMDTTERGTLRLAGGNSTAGRLEIHLNGLWGTVCDDMWSIADARVACRQLGFTGAISAPGGATFGQGTGPTQMDDVRCTGGEERLVNCKHIGSAKENCGHSEDAGVVCYLETEENGAIRLADGNDTAGRVEVYLDGDWGTVCDDYWEIGDADVACRQLGFTGAISALVFNEFGQGSGRILMDDVGCSGDEKQLIDCSYVGSAGGTGFYQGSDDRINCRHSEDAGVVCNVDREEPENGAIRLASVNATAGRVEVYVNHEWGTVCDDHWGIQEAHVACRQLGFTGATSAPGYAAFGEGSGRTQMDNVECSGREGRLIDCPHITSAHENCHHHEDAGVVCYGGIPADGALRLVNGNATAGRVEAYLDGEWGTVCDDEWGLEDAHVACRQLGFAGATLALVRAAFGEGSGRTQLDNVRCSGGEERLVDCAHVNSTEEDCGHSEDAGAVCYVDGQELGAIRLANGTDMSGRVEVYLDSVWGTVCDDDWGLEEADVTCRQLGFAGATSAPVSATFGEGEEPIHMSNVRCSGHEERLIDCTYFDADNCGHIEDAGVVCYAHGTENGALRLVNGNDTAGRVEVYLNSEWGTVCDDSWDMEDAHVACRQLGFTGATFAAVSATFGEGEGPIHMDNVGCSGDEEGLVDCYYFDSSYHNCGHNEDAGVVCYVDENEPESGAIRLASGNATAGRVEVYLDHEWGTVCDDHWEQQDAQVACRQLGFTGANSAPGHATFGEGRGRTQMDNVNCSGSEERLIDCQYIGFAYENCGHDEDAGVVCYGNTRPADGDIRLVNGTDPGQGRVEVYLNGEWGTVCDDSWEIEDANIACRQLGFAGAISASVSARFGPGTGPTQMDNVDCSGWEERLSDCSHVGPDREDCSHLEDAGVVCYVDYGPARGTIRLVDGTDMSGRVEVYLDSAWGTVCDDGWGLEDAEVVCRQLGFTGATFAPTSATFGEGEDPIHMIDVGCSGNEERLIDCLHFESASEYCEHSEDAGVVCYMGENGDIRLVNGNDTAGRVEVFLDGEWGTVCDDYWEREDADVACRQLGFTRAISAPKYARFGEGSGRILMDNVECSGREERLVDCPHVGSADENCLHSEDAGAVCSGLLPP